MVLRVLLALLLASSALAGDIQLGPYERPVGMAADVDGTLWFASSYTPGVARVRPTGELDRIPLPQIFVVDDYAPIVILPDGVVLFGSVNGVIAKVDPELHATLIELGSNYAHVTDMVLGPDGAVWFVASDYTTPPFLGRLNLANHSVQRFALPGNPTRMRVAPDGTFVIATGSGLLRATTAGTFEVIRECQYCAPPWLEVTPDGTIWFGGGRIEPDGRFVPAPYDGEFATIGPDGGIWTADRTNALFRLNEHGVEREIPFADPDDVPGAMVASGGALWYGVPGAIRRLDPETNVPLQLQSGDVVTIEQEPNCCFEGTHPVLAFHRRGRAPFVRRIERTENGNLYHGDVYALDAQHIVIEDDDWGENTSDDPIALVLDGTGAPRASIPGPQDGFGSGIVFDRTGRMYALRRAQEKQLVTIGADGTVERTADIAFDGTMEITAVDLAADQCTLFYTAHSWDDGRGRIGKLNVCDATVLPAFLEDLPDRPLDLRILGNGDLLVVYYDRLARYDAAGAVVHQLDAALPDESFASVALDRDPRYVWIGSRDLRRVNLATGAIVERLPVYGYPGKISVVGEPRAARLPARRRVLRR